MLVYPSKKKLCQRKNKIGKRITDIESKIYCFLISCLWSTPNLIAKNRWYLFQILMRLLSSSCSTGEAKRCKKIIKYETHSLGKLIPKKIRTLRPQSQTHFYLLKVPLQQLYWQNSSVQEFIASTTDCMYKLQRTGTMKERKLEVKSKDASFCDSQCT